MRRRLDRLLIRLLARQRGQAQAIRDVAYVREVLRFSAIFGFFVLLPMLILAFLAVRSLEAEEVSTEASLRGRAAAIASQARKQLDRNFEEFEASFRSLVSEGDLAVERLYDSQPALRAIFRFEPDGQIAFPYAPRTPAESWPEPHASFERALRSARQAEQAGDLRAAITRFTDAAGQATHPAHEAAALLAAGRSMLAAGDPRAEARLITLAATFPRARDESGFRVADLATLLRAQHKLRRGEADDGIAMLRGLVEASLAAPWVIGMPAEAFTARQALRLLEGRVDNRWFQLASEEIAIRSKRIYWAGGVADELQLIASRPHRNGQFTYEPEERSLWAIVLWDDSLWAFSFDAEDLQSQLIFTVLRTANAVDPDLHVELRPIDAEPADVLARVSLAPELPKIEAVVRPADPVALASERLWSRNQRSLVIALAVIAATLGIVAAAQIVNRELDTARQKSDFAANVSHELRSPITQIRLKAESLQLDLCYDDADRQAHYDAIVNESERLSRLVDNVLDFAAIERGVKQYSLRAGDLGDVLRATARTFAPSDGAEYELALEIPDDLPAVWFDRDAVAQVVTNLLSNALKYGAEARWARLSAWVDADTVKFAVEDRGIGIARADLERVFEHFYRVESADVRKRRGTGIGLTIVRYIVEAHRGTIAVDSTLGVGTTFTVTLPTTPPDDAGA